MKYQDSCPKTGLRLVLMFIKHDQDLFSVSLCFKQSRNRDSKAQNREASLFCRNPPLEFFSVTLTIPELLQRGVCGPTRGPGDRDDASRGNRPGRNGEKNQRAEKAHRGHSKFEVRQLVCF